MTSFDLGTQLVKGFVFDKHPAACVYKIYQNASCDKTGQRGQEGRFFIDFCSS